MERPLRRVARSQRYASTEFRPYVIALGQAALAWNEMLESLASLFWGLSIYPYKTGEKVNYAPLHVWQSSISDRAQIAMLTAVVTHSSSIAWNKDSHREDVIWLAERANNLADSRNDIIHAPLFNTAETIYGRGLGALRQEKIAPAAFLFNKRAKKLSGRENLLKEILYCRNRAIALSDYARCIDFALVRSQKPWPKRPFLQERKSK